MRFWIGNISFAATEDELLALFSEAQVDIEEGSLEMKRDRSTGEFRGFAFVNVLADSVSAMHDCNGTRIHGREIIIREAKPKPRRS